MWGNPARVGHSDANRVGIRLVVIAALALLLGRLFQLQVLQHEVYAVRADANRLRVLSIPAPRGLIFDRNGTLLARNRPSFQLAVVPDKLPDDDPDTDGVDEEYEAILDILLALESQTDRDAALRMQYLFLNILGPLDFRRSLERVNIPFTLIEVEVVSTEIVNGQEIERRQTVMSPDISEPYPVEGLAALIQTRVQLRQQGNASEPIPILNHIERDKAFEIAEESYRLPGALVLETSVREYVYGEVASHILGFMGPIPLKEVEEYRQAGYAGDEQVGLSGIEASYQENLRGTSGTRTIEVDIFGQTRRTIGEVQAPIPGQDILLTLDIRLQQEMYNILLDVLTLKGADSAVAIAMAPQSGQVLGMVSLPSFDNNIFSEGLGEAYERVLQDERKPLINYAIGGLYPPGSTFKIVTAMAGLEENIIDPFSVIVDNGPIYLPNKFFPDDPDQAQEFVSWNHHRNFNHGPLTLRKAIAVSNDIFFYHVGGGYPGQFIGLKQAELAAWAKQLGYGEKTSIDLLGEVTFPVPNDQWKRTYWASNWVTGDSYNMAIGQGYMLATPLQVIQSVVPIANGGTLYQPQLVWQIADAATGQLQDFAPKVIRHLDVDAATLETIRLGMRDAVNAGHGTATRGTIAGVVVAGKTGTAEFCEYDPAILDCVRDEDGNLPTHASYLAFAPFHQPEIAVMVFVYNGGEGSEAAVPVATHILETYFALEGNVLLADRP